MQNLEITGTSTTPAIHFNALTGEMRFEGRSIPEDPERFFSRVIDWIGEYLNSADSGGIAVFKLEYVNSGSSKSFLEIIRMLDEYHRQGKKGRITWFHEEDDESIQELGELYRSVVEMPFEIREIID